MSNNEFTWFDRITRVADTIENEDDRVRFIVAVVDFGTKGIEPDFGYPLNGLFEGVRDSIEQSVDSRMNNKGGRKKNPTFSNKKNPRSENEITPVSNNEKPPVSENEKPLIQVQDQIQVQVQDKSILSGDDAPCDEVIAYLNEKTGKRLNPKTESYRKFIRARFSEGYTLDDFKTVIDNKVDQWGSPPKPGEKDMRPFLRPDTLFRPSHFDSYLNEKSNEVNPYAIYD